MDLSTIVEVIQTNRVQDVNERLSQGWVLLGTQGGTDEEGFPYFQYSMGRPEEADGES